LRPRRADGGIAVEVIHRHRAARASTHNDIAVASYNLNIGRGASQNLVGVRQERGLRGVIENVNALACIEAHIAVTVTVVKVLLTRTH